MENINDRIYIKSNYQIKNNDEILYTRIVEHINYSYFDKYLTINEYILFNFEKEVDSISFLITFETKRYNIDDVKYIYKNNDRFIFKHYGN